MSESRPQVSATVLTAQCLAVYVVYEELFLELGKYNQYEPLCNLSTDAVCRT